MIKSRPVYAPFKLDVSGRSHLLVTDQPAPPASAAPIESWVIKTIAPGIQAPATDHIRAFRAVAELLSHLSHRLARAAIGLRLYVVGRESFIWDVHNLGRAAGLGGAEIHLTRTGPMLRRVYCTHCKTMAEDVAHSIVPCPGCGAWLLVRDHFSRRLAAFMGVKVDAEMPGEIPQPEALAS